jgi:ATP-dependent protease ClpP protease subunit
MEDDFDFMPMTEANKLFVRENGDGSKTYEYYFVGPIGEPETCIELCNALRSCNREDLFILRFNSGGGQVRSGNMVLNALHECEATTIGYIEHDCGSMATFLFLACSEHYVSRYAEWFSHTVQSGHIGGEHETFEASQFLRKQTHKRIKEEYHAFFDENEIDLILKGTHFYLGADEIEERLIKFREYRESVREECDCGECGFEDVTLEGLVKKAVKEALSELNPTSLSSGDIPPEDVDAFNKFVVTGATSVSGQIENGKSPETALPYPVDSTLERGVWYKWEAGEDAEGPPIQAKMTGSILWGDGELTERDVLSYFCWDKQDIEEYTIKAFKIDIEQ